MKNLKTFTEFLNESLLSNIKDAIKNKDFYHLFKDGNMHTNRTKITFDQAKKLVAKSQDLGLQVDLQDKSSWAYKKGDDKTEWYYDGKESYLYYKDEYKQYIK